MNKKKNPRNTWKDKNELKKRVVKYAQELEVSLNSVSVRPMSRKWASFSSAGNLNLNSELIDMPKKLGEYVIVHELVHYHVPNHGKLWKSLMRAYLGNYESLEQRLKQYNNLR